KIDKSWQAWQEGRLSDTSIIPDVHGNEQRSNNFESVDHDSFLIDFDADVTTHSFQDSTVHDAHNQLFGD
ncbi:hypothetical protein Ancab_006551, partial [Ancistrocladus abbreviatus]